MTSQFSDYYPIGIMFVVAVGFVLTTMGVTHLLGPKRKVYHKTTDSKGWMRQYPNRVKDHIPHRPEELWVADITYLSGR